MTYTINENAVDIWVRDNADTMDLSVETDASSVYLDNGRTLEHELGNGSMVSNIVTVDSSMEKVIEGTYDGTYESCKMYGRSLVNLVNTTFESYNNISFLPDSNPSSIKVTSNGKFWSQLRVRPKFIKPNTHYFVAWDSLTGEFENGWVGCYIEGNNVGIDNDLGLPRIVTNNYTSGNFFIFNSRDYNLDEMTIRFHLNGTDNSVDRELSIQIDGLHILEYQEGMEDWDIPYFEGLCDVKMPILKNIGKNLAKVHINKTSESIEDGYVKVIENGTVTQDIDYTDSTELIPIKPNTYYTCSWQLVSGSISTEKPVNACFAFCDKNKEVVKWTKGANKLSPENAYYIKRVRLHWGNSEATLKDFKFTMMLEESKTVTEFEPYKTSILTTPEQVVLRKVGDVCDSYDALTGEYVQRIGEVVLDGSEDWVANSTLNTTKTTFFFLPNPCIPSTWGRISAKWRCLPNNRFVSTEDRGSAVNQKIEWISGGDGSTGMIQILINTERLSTPDVSGFKQWLSQNPVTVQYELEVPITTTIEPSTIPFVYENGHIILESGHEGQSLLPTLEYQTVVSRSGQVAMIDKTIQQHERKITLLEKMLVQNIIDIEYKNTLLALKLEIDEVI